MNPRADLPELPADAILVPGDASAPLRAGAKRQLERAPILLRNAAVLLVAAGLLPWVGHGGSWVTLIAAKALVLLGGWLFLESIKVRTGEPVPGALQGLARAHWGPKPGERAKGAKALLAPVPSALHLVAWLMTVAGLLLPLFDPAGAAPESEFSFGKALTEVGLLAWGVATWVHIAAYERGGGFSPMYPFVFLAPGIGGVFTMMKALSATPKDWIAVLGSALAIASGMLAVYTITVAMLQAKKQGDAKRTAALEARRAARKSGGGAGARTR